MHTYALSFDELLATIKIFIIIIIKPSTLDEIYTFLV